MTLGASCDHAVVVGDTAVDIATAIAAGLPAIGVTWGAASAPDLAEAGANAVVDGPDSLVQAVIHALGVAGAYPQGRW
jgi:phosphoglycolate phosphatase